MSDQGDAELTRKAQELGLQKLVASTPDDLKKALENGRALAGRLPVDLHWTDEPAHIFSLAPKKGAR